MSKQMQSVLMLVTLISYAQFAVCSEYHTETALEKSMHRLKANMKIFEEQSRNFGMEEFTAFNVTKRGVTVQETLEMYKYFFGILEQDEKITVLTIRNNHLPETDSLEKCLANIVTATQNHMFEKRNETFFDDECITIECIDREEIVEYEALSKNLGQIEQMKVSVAVYMLDNIAELIGGALKQFVFDLIVDSLNHFFERCFKIEKYSSCRGILRPEEMRAGFLKESTEKIIGDVDNFRWCSLEGMVAKCKNAEIYSIYSVLKLFIVDFEGKNNLSFFGDDEKAIKNLCIDVFNRYSYVFEQITIQMAQKSALHLRSSDDKQLLPSILNFMFDKIEGNNRLDSKTIKKLITVGIRNQIMCQLKNDSSFMTECRVFLEESMVQPTEYFAIATECFEITKKLQSDNVAKLIFRGELNESRLCLLCDILRHTEIIEKLHGHQFIYIDFERAMSEEQLINSLSSFKARSTNLTDESSIIDHKFEAIKVFSKAKPDVNDMEPNNFQMLTYKTNSVAIKEESTFPVYTKGAKVEKHASIMVKQSDEQSFEQFRKICASDAFGIIGLYTIKFVSDSETIDIYITKDISGGTHNGNTILTYNMSRKENSDFKHQCSQPICVVKTVKRPLTLIDSLCKYLQLQQMTIGLKFEIPNLILSDGVDYIYTERTIEASKDDLDCLIKDNYKNTYICQSRMRKSINVPRSEIVRGYGQSKFKRTSVLPYFIEDLGLSVIEVHRLLNQFSISRHIRDGATEDQNELFTKLLDKNLTIFVTRDVYDNYVLHLLEYNDYAAVNLLYVQASRLLTKILSNEKDRILFKMIRYARHECNLEVTFLAMLIAGICKKKSLSELSKADMNLTAEKIKYTYHFKQCFDALVHRHQPFTMNEDTNETESKKNLVKFQSLYQITLQKYLNQGSVNRIINKIFEEISGMKSKSVMKWTSIKLMNRQIDCDDGDDMTDWSE